MMDIQWDVATITGFVVAFLFGFWWICLALMNLYVFIVGIMITIRYFISKIASFLVNCINNG